MSQEAGFCYKGTLVVDTSIAEQQISELVQLIKSRFPKGVPRHVLSDLKSLSLDVVFSDHSSTLRADGTVKVIQRLRFGSRFESFRTALLTDEGNHVTNFT